MRSDFVNRVGMKYGRLTVIAFAGKRGRNKLWACECECGKSTITQQSGLVSGQSKSCGCLHRDIVRKTSTTHGATKNGLHAPEYFCWVMMRRRCNKPKATGYHRYGGRGISICERWDSFENFLEDMGPRSSPLHTVDRIDNNGPYCKENCRWATHQEQMNNQSRCTLFTHNGKTQSIATWARELGVPYNRIMSRLTAGWSLADAILKPCQK